MRDDVLNISDVWREGYERLLDEAVARGEVQLRDRRHERRQHPRFPVRSQDIATPEDGPVAVENMSVSGVSFVTAECREGVRLATLSLAKVFSTDLDVVACERLPDGPGGEPRHRMRCRFRNPQHGLQFLTLTLELERIEEA